MIDNIKYEDLLSIAKELENCCNIIKRLLKDKELPELEDFVSSVDIYYKYIENTVELNKVADSVLKNIIK